MSAELNVEVERMALSKEIAAKNYLNVELDLIMIGRLAARRCLGAPVVAPLTDEQIKAIPEQIGMVVSHDGKYMRSIGTYGGMTVQDGIAFARAIEQRVLASQAAAPAAPSASIYTEQFNDLLVAYRKTFEGIPNKYRMLAAKDLLIAHIHAWHASKVAAIQSAKGAENSNEGAE